MPVTCYFSLNGMPLSLLRCCGIGISPALSGQKSGRNHASLATVKNIGSVFHGLSYLDMPTAAYTIF